MSNQLTTTKKFIKYFRYLNEQFIPYQNEAISHKIILGLKETFPQSIIKDEPKVNLKISFLSYIQTYTEKGGRVRE